MVVFRPIIGNSFPLNKAAQFMLLFVLKTLSRYLVVCHATAMIGREKNIGKQIIRLSVSTSVGISLLSLLYRDHTFHYLFCMGRMESFYFDIESPFSSLSGGAGIKLDFFNPFRLSVNIVGYSFLFVVPTLYAKIFQFRKLQDTSISGIGIIKIVKI